MVNNLKNNCCLIKLNNFLQVLKANTFINKLTTEMAEKEPEVAKLNAEIEQLNKRLSQVLNRFDIFETFLIP